MGIGTFDEFYELVNPRMRDQDSLLNVQFYSRDVMDLAETEKSGRPIYKKQDFVKIRAPGDPLNIIDQPVWHDPNHSHAHTNRFRRQWEDYKAGKAQEQAGTPLMALTYLAPPILTSERVPELKHFGIHTAEQLADLSDDMASRFMGGYDLKRKAKAYLEMAAKNAPQAAMLAELNELREKVALLEMEREDRETAPATKKHKQ